MLINLTKVFLEEGKKEHFTVPVQIQTFSGSLGEYAVKDCSDFDFSACHIRKGRAQITGSVRIVFDSVCDRCLKPTETVLALDIDTEVSSPEDSEMDPEEESTSFMDGYSLDTSALLYNEISVNWPVKILCREECKGLCLVCGNDLNVRDCGCDTFVPDPRMAVLSEIFDSNKEV